MLIFKNTYVWKYIFYRKKNQNSIDYYVYSGNIINKFLFFYFNFMGVFFKFFVDLELE